jgi:outer membrane protein insertion porin family
MHRIFNVTSPTVRTPHSLSHQFALWQKSSHLSPRALTPILALAWGTTMVSQAQASTSDLPQLSVAAHNFEPIIRVHTRIAPLEKQEKAAKTPDSPVLIAQAGTNQGNNNQPNKPAASPDAKTEPEGLKVPIGEKKDENPPQPPVEIGPRTGGSTLPRPGGSTLPAPTITTPATNAASNQEGPNEAAIAQAEGREVAQVRIVGLRVIPEESVLLQATNIRRGAAFSRRQAELDRAKIASMGFFASVQYQVTPNLEDAAKVDVAFVVIENRVVTGFAFEGNKTVPTAELQKVVQTQSGGVLNNNTLNADVEKLQDFYRERGFAALITEVKQREDGTVAFTIQEAKVSRIVLSGLRKTKESLVRKLIRTKPGDAFDQRKLQRDLNQMYDTGFFEDVTYKIDDDPDQPGGLIITISVKEKRTGTFTLGVGFDSASRISGFVTLGESNFQGSGKRVSASVEVGGQQTFDLGYGNPFIGPNNAAYNASLYSRRIYREPRFVNLITQREDEALYEERRTGGRLDYTLPLDINRTASLIFGFRNEKATLKQTDLLGEEDPAKLGRISIGQVFAPSIGYVRDKRDLRLDPSRGGREQIILEKAFPFLGGDSNFTKVDLDLRRYIPLIKAAKRNEQPKLVLAGRFVLGKAFGQLPAFEQYFVGGSDTVRGYDTDEQFGDNQIYGNIELRYRLQRKFQIVGFIDAGSAYGGAFSPGNPKAIVGIGGGIRVQTPIGPLRLDIGRGDDGIKTHFGIGAQF